MRRILALALIALFAIGLIGFAQVGTRTEPIKMVLVPSTHGAEILEIGEGIAEALSGLTGLYIEAILQPDYAAMVETFGTSDGDVFGFPASVQYLSIFERTNGGVTARLASVRYGSTTYQAGLYARRDSGINSVLDCHGKKWLATDELSTSGNVIPSIVFEKWGIVPSEKVFTEPSVNSTLYAPSWLATNLPPSPASLFCLGSPLDGPVPCTRQMKAEEIREDYEANTGKVIVERFKGLASASLPGVLVAQHGPLAWGASPDDAVDNAARLEYIARLATETIRIEPYPAPAPRELLRKHFLRKHGPNAYYGQES